MNIMTFSHVINLCLTWSKLLILPVVFFALFYMTELWLYISRSETLGPAYGTPHTTFDAGWLTIFSFTAFYSLSQTIKKALKWKSTL